LPVHPVSRGIVFVLDGSGRLQLMAKDLRCVVEEAGLSLAVEEFNWSYGNYRVLSDLRIHSNHCASGQALAGRILCYRAARPGDCVFVVTHSAGAAVAIAAAACLPPGSVDRFILLAPAVSPDCDVQPAVVASRQGVDVFCSHKDIISIALAITGCADGKHVFSAGRNGFAHTECDACSRLRHHFYTAEMASTGHHGGHYGWTKIGFLREYVVPLLSCDCASLAAPAHPAAPR
jgi:hypothetical protein